MDNETPTAQLQEQFGQRFVATVVEAWKAGHRFKALLLLLLFFGAMPFIVLRALFSEKFFWGVVLIGMVGTAVAAAGQCLSIGFHAAWTLYKYAWLASPLYGPAILLASLIPVAILKGIEKLIRRLGKPQYAKAAVGITLAVAVASGIFLGTYYGTQQDNPMLNSQNANLDALNKTVGEQSRVLGNLSESGKALLGQLNATQLELDNTKKQLSSTLSNFEAQRQAAGRASAELKEIDSRQTQIALQTEELARILDGKRPLTQQDLNRANWYGQLWGFFVGFAASLLATFVYSAFQKRKAA